MLSKPMTARPRDRWAAAWVGRAAEDCADLVRQVRRAEFGHDLILPQTPGSLRARDRTLAEMRTILARPLGAHEKPREGDGVLMRAATRTRALGHHIGLWTGETGTACVLHHMAGPGSCLHPLARLDNRGLTCAGLYRWL